MLFLLSLIPFIEESKWYRRKVGGKWYRIVVTDQTYHPMTWTQTPDRYECKIVNEEKY